ncbi:hypothetical protein [Micromonospora sp. NPDC005806]|uniref:hypothetical protein n=1 Tax=Micromonospora sp. NPDC005806 TaxID=3364234 RepID=UPI00369BCC21
MEWQLLCGAGPDHALDQLRALATAEAEEVLAYLSAIDPEDVAAFSVEEQSACHATYYAGGEVS